MKREIALKHIRLDAALSERIEQAANADGRSVNSEIERRLALSFEHEATVQGFLERLNVLKVKGEALKARQQVMAAAMKKAIARMSSEQTVDLLETFLTDVGEEI